jgi:uncharacterized membrane protein
MTPTFSTSRLEAFSDGVIAVIITIMVLELHIPPGPDTFAAFRTIVPTLSVYAISFGFVGTYWINHHYLIARTERVHNRILWSNLFFLFLLSLVPFFTNYVLEKHRDAFSVALYATSNAVTGFGFLMLRLAIGHHLRTADVLLPTDTGAEVKNWGSLGLYLVAIPTAFFHPSIALVLIAGVTVLWVVPTFGTEPCPEDLATANHPTSPQQ